ncbi:MAG: sigma-70 family RNA polymerase sigma factor [Phycisphaeraceae bacterium]|nr:sigma-70 family RNA polymerase sigma factor [Phycisphaeraceae bacterium]
MHAAAVIRQQSDLVLIERFRYDGDEMAFAELVHRYADHVYGTCLRILRDPAQAEDATQETFFKLLKQPNRVRESIGGWLHRVATRLSIDRIRSESRRRQREQVYAQQNPPIHIETWDELAPHIDAALDLLPDDAREILVRHFLYQQTLADLAEEAGVSKATMTRRCRDALEKMRTQLARRGLLSAAAGLSALFTTRPVEAAPSTLKLTLGRMALGSSVSTGAALVTSGGGIYVSWQAIASAVLLILCVIAVCLMLYSQSGLNSPPASNPASQDIAP